MALDPTPQSDRIVPGVLPVIPAASAAVFPGTVATVHVGPLPAPWPDGESLRPGAAVVVVGRVGAAADPGAVPRVGVLARVLRCLEIPGGALQLSVEGLARVQVDAWRQLDGRLAAEVTPLDAEASREGDAGYPLQERVDSVLRLAEQLLRADARQAEGLHEVFRLHRADPGRLADVVAGSLQLPLAQKLAIVETLDEAERLQRLEHFLRRGLEPWRYAPPSDETDEAAGAARAAHERAGSSAEIQELLEQLETAKTPAHVTARLRRDIDQLRSLVPGSYEHAELRVHIDWVLGLPWRVPAQRSFDLDHVQRVLDEEHYGQAKAKERILEYLAVLRLRRDAPSPVLCLVGPPGTGKSSLARAVAKALGREFVLVSVAGVRDEAEIRGRRRPHAAAQPGLILETLRHVGSPDPVFVVDDIDKLGHDGTSTDASGALLDVADAERNRSFIDHYLELPYDLSPVLFILTANMLELVPETLVDRLEVIEIPGYTEADKVQIVRHYLLPRALERHGLEAGDLTLSTEAIMKLIREYALEAGLRSLLRQIESICRKCARRYARGDLGPWDISPEEIESFLGPPVHIPEVAEREPEVGVAMGLAWTPAGGDLLPIETIRMPGGGRMVATGQLGEVMRESVQAAFSLVRTRAEFLGIPNEAFTDVDLHVHFPAGGIPKDGPSAGVTITLALASLLSDRPVRNDVATTGEVSLRGKVLPVGGVREKVMAAHRTGIRTVILPRANLKNLADLPDSVRSEMQFIGVEHMDEVFQHALLEPAQAEAQPEASPAVLAARKAARRRKRRARRPRLVTTSRAAREARGSKKKH
ncbi:MAG TPA: endopeptidase La [Candidatus Saccharimonadales bacterium]|nr:endopeptidase La [Candidatus Saccharimonadales bacterium]